MKQTDNSNKVLPILLIIFAIMGFVLITFSGKMSSYMAHGDNDIMMYLVPFGIGIIMMIPLLLYILKAKKQ